MFTRASKKNRRRRTKTLGARWGLLPNLCYWNPPVFSCYDRAAPHRDFIFFPFQSLNSCLFFLRQAKDGLPLWALGCSAGVHVRPQFGVGVLGQPHLQWSQQQGEDAGQCPVRHLQCCCLLLFYSRHKNVQLYVCYKLSLGIWLKNVNSIAHIHIYTYNSKSATLERNPQRLMEYKCLVVSKALDMNAFLKLQSTITQQHLQKLFLFFAPGS